MTSVSTLVERLWGNSFELHCLHIEVRGRSDSGKPYFRGPGFLSGATTGALQFHLYHLARVKPLIWTQLQESLRQGTEVLRVFATDMDGVHWVGSWCPGINLQLDHQGRCLISGELDQLAARLPLTAFEPERNLTALYYLDVPRLPMLSGAEVQTLRDGQVEETRYLYDRSKLDFGGAEVMISTDEANHKLMVSCAHRPGWLPPICEVGLADAISFVTATVLSPRLTVRYQQDHAQFFVRRTPAQPRRFALPAIAKGPPVGPPMAVWDVFLAFLKDCEHRQQFDSTPLARAFHEVALASTGTVHGFVLTLVATIEELTYQIVGKVKNPEKSKLKAVLSEFKKYVQNWGGDVGFKDRVLGILQSSLLAIPAKQHLEGLAVSGVVTPAQIKIWAQLRPKLAHGKIIDYADEQLAAKRDALITMFYGLARRLLDLPVPPPK